MGSPQLDCHFGNAAKYRWGQKKLAIYFRPMSLFVLEMVQVRDVKGVPIKSRIPLISNNFQQVRVPALLNMSNFCIFFKEYFTMEFVVGLLNIFSVTSSVM